MTITIDLGLFAYNEAENIGTMLENLSRQDLFEAEGMDARIFVLANGCRDDTVARAHTAIEALSPSIRDCFEVIDFAEGGKSRTWNRFVHEVSRPQADMLCFLDADITLPEPDTLARLVQALTTAPKLQVAVSSPVKDATLPGADVGRLARLIAGGTSLDSGRTAICGQLYMMKADRARALAMPVGLPVEDGFLRAMVLTDALTRPEDLQRINREPEVFHVFESIRTPGALLRHQQRIVLGSAINAALFRVLKREAKGDEAKARQLLFDAAQNEDWLGHALDGELPRLPYGWVPLRFMTKRMRTAGNLKLRPKPLVMLILGVGLDIFAWVGASLRMARGRGVGHW